MRFLLYNIRYGTGTGWKSHFPVPFSGYLRRTGHNFHQIADFIKAVNPDVTGLIEVDCGSFRSNRDNQARLIGEAIRHHHVFENKYGGRSMVRKLPLFSKQGNAFLTNQDIRALRFHYFKHGVKRLVIEAELEEFTTFVVHLSLQYRHRREQLRHLDTLVRASGKPVIVAGDFNVFRGEGEMRDFLGATGLLNANATGQPSHPSRRPRRQLDFILHSPEIKARRFEAPLVPFSDHIPLIWDFEIRQRAGLARAA